MKHKAVLCSINMCQTQFAFLVKSIVNFSALFFVYLCMLLKAVKRVKFNRDLVF